MRQGYKFMSALVLLLSLVLGLSTVQTSRAQEGVTPMPGEGSTESCACPVDVSFGVKIKSGHIWNGGLSYPAVNMQADFTVSAYGFYFNAWSIYCIDNEKETDLCLGYSWEYLDFCFIDMYYPMAGRPFHNYFAPIHPSTPYHQGWLQFTFSGVEKFPIRLTAGAFTYGDFETIYELDPSTGEPVKDVNGNDKVLSFKERYSTYLGIGYSHTISKTGLSLTYELGVTPFKGNFAKEFNVVNINCKMVQPVQISSSYSINLLGELAYNPARTELYFTAGIGF